MPRVHATANFQVAQPGGLPARGPICGYNFAEVHMAKDDNLELIQAIYSAYAQGDSQFILDRTTDDVDWINEGPNSIPYAGTFN